MADPAASLSHCHTVTVSCHTTDNCKLSRSRVTQNTARAPLPDTGHWPAAAQTVVISPNTTENLLFYYSTHFSLQGPGIKHFTMPEIRLLGLLAPINYTALPVTDSREHTWPRGHPGPRHVATRPVLHFIVASKPLSTPNTEWLRH